jgi:predicted MFS family arabinose efflux permease
VNSAVAAARRPRRAAQDVRQRLEEVVGGPTRAKVVLLFACVLALESADLATIGAAAPQLEASLHTSNAGLGTLAAVSTLVGAIATLPAGALADRLRRVSLLAAAVLLWALAMAASAVAPDFTWLLLSRIGLGAVTAAAGPVVASLTGDFFEVGERGKIYGYILSGELLGAAFGFVISGSIASAVSWRVAFAVMIAPAAILGAVIWRRLPEPARAGPDRSRRDDQDLATKQVVIAQGVDPVAELVLRDDPAGMKLRRAVRYVLSIATNRWLIAASVIGYFFFAGMRTFALVFVRGHFGLSQPLATLVLLIAGIGALGGVLTAGRLADRLIRRGTTAARVLVGAVSYFVATALLIPSLLADSVFVAAPILLVAAAGLAAPNPPLDAARLDVVPSRLWGRAEGVRTLLRQTAQAAAPVAFGLLADGLGGASATASHGPVSPATAHALQLTFLIMLVPLAVSGGVLLAARRGYPRDVATAIAGQRAGDRGR